MRKFKCIHPSMFEGRVVSKGEVVETDVDLSGHCGFQELDVPKAETSDSGTLPAGDPPQAPEGGEPPSAPDAGDQPPAPPSPPSTDGSGSSPLKRGPGRRKKDE